MQTKIPFRIVKTVLIVLLTSFVATVSYADVSVSRTRIGGRTASVSRNGWGEFECLASNPDLTGHIVQVRVKPAKDETQRNIYSGTIFLPPETTSYLRFPMVAENAKKYSVEVFCDGKKIPSGTFNDVILNQLPVGKRVWSVLNDSDESPGFFFHLPAFKADSIVQLLRKQNAPENWLYYQDSEAILIGNPDFSRYSAAQIQAIRTYAAEGGTVVFLNPEGLRKAAETPLSDLLPIIPGKIIRADELDLSVFLPGKLYPAVSTDFLVSVPQKRCVTAQTYESMPLLAEAQYGLGMVRVLCFEPKQELFQGKDDLAQSIIKRLVTKQTLYPNPAEWENHLNKLTGFRIPDSSTVAGLIYVFVSVFLVIILSGVLFHRMGTAWIAAVIASLIMIGVILSKAAMSFEKHHSVLAELSVENMGPVRSGEVFASCFMVPHSTVNVSREDADVHFSTILKSPKIGFYSAGLQKEELTFLPDFSKKEKAVQTETLLDLVRNVAGRESISDLDIAPRTSKQFRARFVIPGKPVSDGANKTEPELLLSDKELALAPYAIPEEIVKEGISSVWLIMPGGVRKVAVDKKGNCSLGLDINMIRDESSYALAETICRGLRKPSPCLAVILPVKKNFLQLSNPVKPEGKRILMIPVRMTVTTRTVRIPSDLLVFSPADVSSRILVNGNDVLPKMQIMSGFAGSIRLSLPGCLAPMIQPSGIDISADTRMDSSVTLDVFLATPSGQKEGIRTGAGKFTFREGLRGMIPDERAAILLYVRSRYLIELEKLSPEQRVSACSWYMRSLKAEITGTLDESINLPAKF